jgi:hypothetical protein
MFSVLVTVTPYSHASDVGEMQTKFRDKYHQLKTIIEENKINTIYTESAFKQKVVQVDLKDKDLQKYVLLKNAGGELLNVLQRYNEMYHKLKFQDWVYINNLLFDIDNIASQGNGWGNMVIRINIYNKILYKIRDYVSKDKVSLNEEKLDTILETLFRMRTRFPSRYAMAKIALRHYGIIPYKEIDSAKLNTPVEQEKDNFMGEFQNMLKKGNDFEAIYFRLIKEESDHYVKDYIDYYEHPIPWVTTLLLDYNNYTWELYILSRIMKEEGKDFDMSKDLTKKLLQEFIKKEYNNYGKFWISKKALRFAGTPDRNLTYLNSVKNETYLKYLDKIKRQYKKKIWSTELGTSPHMLP